MGYISEQQQLYPCFRKRVWLLLLGFVFLLSKPLTLKGEGARALSPFTGVLKRVSLLSGSASLPGSNHRKPGPGRRTVVLLPSSDSFSPENQNTHEEWPGD